MAIRRLRRVLGVTALAIPGLMAGMLSSTALPVSAQTPGCVSSGSTTICTFVSTGTEQSFKVPAGVTQLGVKLVGAPGGNGGKTGTVTPTGGKGATVNATLSGLTPGKTLYVNVGGKGGDGGLIAVGAGGFNGGAFGGAGGSASGGGGGGGGESDIRTCSAAASCPQTLTSRLVIAAGGGAAGGTGSARCGSPAGGAGQDSATLQTTGGAGSGPGGAGGGVEGNKAGGGAGGAAGTVAIGFPGSAGFPGVLQTGGPAGLGTVAGATAGGGGGGGGGLFGGGGGGGAGASVAGSSGGGGGGGCGSSSTPPGGTITPDTTGVPEVVLSYSVPAPVASPALPGPPATGRFGASPLPLRLLGLLLLSGASVVAWRAFENARDLPQRER